MNEFRKKKTIDNTCFSFDAYSLNFSTGSPTNEEKFNENVHTSDYDGRLRRRRRKRQLP